MSLRCGYVAVVGLPNAGKSTLVNALVGERVSIVSSKPQTTRQRVTGVYTGDKEQVIFFDAPGFIQADSGLNKFIQSEWESSIEEADVVLGVLNIDADSEAHIDRVIENLKSIERPKLAFINKVDLKKDVRRLFMLEEKLRQAGIEYLFGSASKLKDDLKETLLKKIVEHLPEQDYFLCDTDVYTLQTLREMTSEIIREKCFLTLAQEIPYQLAVHVRLFEENSHCIRIFAEIWVSKERYKKMVVGAQGSKIVRIGTLARKDIQTLVRQKVFLDLNVKVKENWNKNQQIMKELGYDIRKPESATI
ncbi:MAG: GTPase Era [Bdellovibrionaceae bacterium]|nr:GTPase Era [Pseudobdellovibrionaceae bacterium]